MFLKRTVLENKIYQINMSSITNAVTSRKGECFPESCGSWLAYSCVLDKSQMPPKMISVFNNEYFFPRDSILVDSSFKCQAENGQIR